jgi:hypothetical protein
VRQPSLRILLLAAPPIFVAHVLGEAPLTRHVNVRPSFSAKLFGALTLLVVAFQLALAAGAPWGRLAMGGAFPGRFPPPMRAAAVAQALVLLLFGAVVFARAGLVLPRWAATSRRLIWVVVGFMAVGAVLNALTPSPWERAVWLPMTLALLGCSVVVARSA